MHTPKRMYIRFDCCMSASMGFVALRLTQPENDVHFSAVE